VGKGDEVITTPFSFAATGNAVLYVGARPVFVDIDPETYNIDPRKIEDAINPHTKALLPVHLYGQPADMDPIMEIASDNELCVIEDAAQAHGAIYNGKMAGSLGDMACFSFYPTKNMTTSEGGIITTDDAGLADECRILRAHGERGRYQHVVLGYNFRMTDIAAAIGLAQLKKLDTFNQKRIENAAYLTEHIKEIEGVKSPYVQENVQHVFHQFTIRIESGLRDEWITFLNENGVGTGIHYPKPIYQQELYQELGFTDNCPEAEKAAKEVISIPVHPSLKVEDLEIIVQTLEDASRNFM
jgi:perosamine synthetase